MIKLYLVAIVIGFGVVFTFFLYSVDTRRIDFLEKRESDAAIIATAYPDSSYEFLRRENRKPLWLVRTKDSKVFEAQVKGSTVVEKHVFFETHK